MAFATGKFAVGICDRCGQQYKLLQLKKEWNGLFTCPECWEPKHPQLEPRPTTADGQGLRNARPQIFTVASGDGGFMTVDLTLPAPFAFSSNSGMIPDDGSAINRKREAQANLGRVTINIS